jgi:Ulp1 family protease
LENKLVSLTTGVDQHPYPFICVCNSISSSTAHLDYIPLINKFLIELWNDQCHWKFSEPVSMMNLLEIKTPLVPQQGNGCDCGLYTLYFINSLIKYYDPDSPSEDTDMCCHSTVEMKPFSDADASIMRHILRDKLIVYCRND